MKLGYEAGTFYSSLKDLKKSDVYCSLSLLSRAIFEQIEARHSGLRNNGWIMYTIADARRHTGVQKQNTIVAAFQELIDKGFLVETWRTSDPALIAKGYGRTWLLTCHPADISGTKIPASNAWTEWGGKAVKLPKLPSIYPPDRAAEYGKQALPSSPKREKVRKQPEKAEPRKIQVKAAPSMQQETATVIPFERKPVRFEANDFDEMLRERLKRFPDEVPF